MKIFLNSNKKFMSSHLNNEYIELISAIMNENDGHVRPHRARGATIPLISVCKIVTRKLKFALRSCRNLDIDLRSEDGLV